jgi:hypothetical protein
MKSQNVLIYNNSSCHLRIVFTWAHDMWLLGIGDADVFHCVILHFFSDHIQNTQIHHP